MSRGGLKETGLVSGLDAIRKRSKSMTEHFNKSDPERGKAEVISKETAVILMQEWGTFCHFCDLDSVHSVVCVQTQYRVLLFMS